MTVPDPQNTVVIVPARMASTRLPGKPLADICGEPMIVHVWRRAIEAEIGPVIVAAADREIVDVVRAAGGDAELTDPQLPSGSDRGAVVLSARDPEGRYAFVVNLQGDLPLIDPASIRACLSALADTGSDVSTLVAEIEDDHEVTSPDVVKAIVKFADEADVALALDFVRLLPDGAKPPYWHHIGIYGYRREAIERYVALPQSTRERERRLEQMRALDNAMTISVARVDSIPFGVDTPADLERARRQMSDVRGSREQDRA